MQNQVRFELPGKKSIVVTIANGSGTVESNLAIVEGDADYDADYKNDWNANIEGIESLLLACACNGVDIESASFRKAIAETIEHIANNVC